MLRTSSMAASASLICLAACAILPGHPADCPRGPFETNPSKIVAPTIPYVSPDTMGYTRIPIEADETRNGAVGGEVGGLEGPYGEAASGDWGYDEDRGLFFETETLYAPNNPAWKPDASIVSISLRRPLNPNAVRKVRTADHSAQIVTVLVATPEQTAKFHCLENALLAVPSPWVPPREIRRYSDAYSTGLDLVKDGKRITPYPDHQGEGADQIKVRIHAYIDGVLFDTSTTP